MVQPNDFTVKCDSCHELVQPEQPDSRSQLIIGSMAVFGGIGFLTGTSLGIVTAGFGATAAYPLGGIGIYAGYKTGGWVAESLDGYTCPNCGAEIAPERSSHPHQPRQKVSQKHGETPGDDGTSEYDEALGENHCSECGTEIHRQVDVCADCGARRRSLTGDSRDSNQVVAGLLAILLGVVGAHKFYQGHTKLGIVYVFLSWTLIPAILGFIEGILILRCDEEEYERRYAGGSLLGDAPKPPEN